MNTRDEQSLFSWLLFVAVLCKTLPRLFTIAVSLPYRGLIGRWLAAVRGHSFTSEIVAPHFLMSAAARTTGTQSGCRGVSLSIVEKWISRLRRKTKTKRGAEREEALVQPAMLKGQRQPLCPGRRASARAMPTCEMQVNQLYHRAGQQRKPNGRDGHHSVSAEGLPGGSSHWPVPGVREILPANPEGDTRWHLKWGPKAIH